MAPAGRAGICTTCNPPYQRVWVAGAHEGVLDATIDAYKFKAVRAGATPLAQLMSDVLPELPAPTVFIPIPTARQHVRERGFDHIQRVTQELARRRRMHCDASLLRRRTNAVQRGASAAQRHNQAKAMFLVHGQLDPDAVYIIVDDVMTTGATINYAALALKQAGAKTIWAAILSRHMG